MESILKQLSWRYAVKQYDRTRKLHERDIAFLEAVVRLSPSSYGLQPYKLLVIDDDALRTQLRAVSYNQPQITDASHLLVFAIDTGLDVASVDAYFDLLCRERQVKLEGHLLQHRNAVAAAIHGMSAERRLAWATHQAYLGLGALLLAAAQIGVDANPMEGFIASRYDELLRLPEQSLGAVVIVGLGYRAADDRFQHFGKVRKSTKQLFIHIGD
jgi:nitroreductase/dihydropteridine reductase